MHTNKKANKYVFDASVAVKLFSNEDGSKEARKLFEKVETGRIELFAPELLLYEVGNALGRGKGLEAKYITQALNILLNSSIDFLSLDGELIGQSAEFMDRYGLTFYDASYVALAFRLSAPMFSANPKDHKKIKEIKVEILS